ncbi:MAG TPA: glutathione ABC transporter substrate-binding protein [Deinococcales bacterium]|nr:glutathione ABC transporter substrate-binding protein [Deinococcales bacterium]
MFKRSVRFMAPLALALLAGGFALAEVLVVAQGTDAVTLDPHDTTDSPSATVTSHLYETLFELTPDGEIVHHLATSHEFTDDGLGLSLTLRDDVTFHDGTPLTAEVVKGSMERFLDEDNAWTFRFLLDEIESITVTGDHSLDIRLANQFAPLLAHLTHSSTAIVLAPDADEKGEDFASNPMGTGPFSFVSWERNDAIDLERFDDYWGDAPGVSGVRFLTVPENSTRMALVESGQAHVAVRVPPQDIARLDATEGMSVENVSSVRTIFMFMNFALEPTNDVRVRQAINHAIDREALAEFVLGGAVRVSDAAVSPGVFGYTPVGVYEYDPEKAQELLAEAGYGDGLSIELYTPSGRYLQDIQTVEAMQEMLAQVGVEATIETLEWSAYLDKVNAAPGENTVPAGLLGWGTVTGDADYGLYPLFHTDQQVPVGSNRGAYSNERVDELLDFARTNNDEDERLEAYEEAMQIIFDDAAWLFLHSETQLVAVRDNVSGLIIHPTERVLAYEATID